MEDLFQSIKKENEDLAKKIPLLRNKQIFNSKELESYSFNKKYPNKVCIKILKTVKGEYSY